MEFVAEVRKAALPNRPKHPAQGNGAVAEQFEIDLRLDEAELELHEQLWVAFMVEPRIHQHAFKAHAAEEPFQDITDGSLDLSWHRKIEVALVSESCLCC